MLKLNTELLEEKAIDLAALRKISAIG